MNDDTRLFRAGLVAVTALVLVVFWPAIYGGVQTMHDMGDWYVPMRQFYARCLAAGDAPEWIPHVFCGYYLQGDGQVGIWHPLHLLLYRTLPISLAVNLEMTIGFVASCVGVFFLLRRWGIDGGVALFGGCAVAFSGYHLQHVEHMNAIQILAHVPWLTLLVDVALRSPSARNSAFAALGVAALTTSELLIGYPQYFWFSNLWEGSYALILMLSPSTRTPPLRVLGLVAAKVCGVAGGAVQLLPTADLLGSSLREAMSRDERAQWAWHPFEWSTLVAPYLFRSHVLATFHPGLVSIVLVAWLLTRRGVRWLWREVPTRLALVVGGISVLLALGRLGLLYELHLDAPLIGVFRMPYRYLSLAALAVGILAAFALRELRRESVGGGSVDARRRPTLYVLPGLGLAVALGVWWLKEGERSFYVTRHFGSLGLALCGIAAMTATVWIVHRIERGRGVRLGTCALLALLVVDLGGYGAQWLYRGGIPVTLEEYQDAIPQPPDPVEGYRVSAALQNQLVFHDVAMPHGYMPMLPDAPLLAEIDEHGPRDETLLRIAGVRWIQDEIVGNRWTQVSGHIDALRAQSRTWIEVPDPMPRARLVARTTVPSELRERGALAAVEASKHVDPARVAVVEVAIPELEGENERRLGTAEITRDRPGAIDVAVEAPEPRLLVVSERTRAGWNAYVDGRPVPVIRTYGTFLGCVVGEGSKRVEFRFEPASLVGGFWVSSVAWTVLAACALVVFTLTRRASPAEGR